MEILQEIIQNFVLITPARSAKVIKSYYWWIGIIKQIMVDEFLSATKGMILAGPVMGNSWWNMLF